MTFRGLLLLVVVGAVVAGGVWTWPRLEGDAPAISAPEELVVGRGGRDVALEIRDSETGLRVVEVYLDHGGESKRLLARTFPGALVSGGAPGSRSQTIELTLDPEEVGVLDGEATLRVTARDWSWRGGLDGNLAETSLPVRFDSQPPGLSLESGLTYVDRGGSAAAVYRVDEVPERDGVLVGKSFYRGHAFSEDGKRRVALFAVPVDAPVDPAVAVVATDTAGNESRVRFPARVVERRFSRDEVNLPESFLERKAVPLAEQNSLQVDAPLNAFERVNTDLRGRNEARIREIVAGSSSRRMWSGAFEQWRNSKVTSRFAELRSYKVGGRPVSEARHYGFDLASTSAAPVTASNAGAVLHAGDLGIYGQCVIVDHGMGLTSLYAHLSQIDVEVGESVEQGQVLGRSGSTGLAGGDHLHFAILVGGTYVDPVEWWDPKWVQEHVEVRLGPPPVAAAPPAAAAETPR